MFCRGGLVTAAALLLTACGGSGKTDDAAAGSSAASSSSAGSSAPEADSAFCTRAQAMIKALDSAFNDQSTDQSSLADQFQQTADAVRSVDPPAEIADDWETIASGLEQFGSAFAKYDPTDPAAASSFAQQSQKLQTEFAGAGANVEKYLSEQCGIDTGTESASPSS